jgi:hypothetical protein
MNLQAFRDVTCSHNRYFRCRLTRGLKLLTHYYLFLTLCVLMPSLYSDNALAQEMLRNPDFEGNYKNGIALFWEDTSWGDTKVQFLEEVNEKHSGNKCQKIVCNSSSTKGAAQIIQRSIAVTYGRQYHINVWMKSPDIKSQVSVNLRKSGTPYTSYVSKSFTITNSWKLYRFEGVSKNTDNNCLITILFQSAGTLYLDNISCMEEKHELNARRFKPVSGRISSDYFGFHIHNSSGAIKVPKQHGTSWRLHDAIVTWADLEKAKGQWDFSRLDRIIAKASEHKINILYTLGVTPEWAASRPDEKSGYYSINRGSSSEPKNINDWINYISVVAKRYKGKIKYYEIWNEPNLEKFYSGSKEGLVELTKAARATLKSIDPTIEVLTPACTGDDGTQYLNDYFKLGGAKYIDVVTYHFYTWGAPESSIESIREVRKVMMENGLGNKPLWNTETGWRMQSSADKNSALLSYETASTYIARAFLVYGALNISRFYIYSWDNRGMGLIERNGEDKPCAAVYQRMQVWLTGKEMTDCYVDTRGVWRLTLTHGTKRYLVIWHPDVVVAIDKPDDATRVQTIYGITKTISEKQTIEIGPSPVLVGFARQE